MNTPSRQALKIVSIWTLQRRDFGKDGHDYVIIADRKTPITLFVDERTDAKTGRTVYSIEYSQASIAMDLEEAQEFLFQAKRALYAAGVFQREINELEGIVNPVI